MGENWHKISIVNDSSETLEIIGAWLNMFDVDSIVETDYGLDTYCDQSKIDGIIEALKSKGLLIEGGYTVTTVEDKNWNEIWESNFEPVDIGDLHVRAEFHPQSHKKEIVIQPKMAFGTGHHATTYMMLSAINALTYESLNVLDYGCGTGILSVLAAQNGAQHIEAIDIQPESIENTVEHFKINKLDLSKLNVHLGNLEQLKLKEFDIILANINRGVLMQRAGDLYHLLKPNGLLFMSGILIEDKGLVIEEYMDNDFQLIEEKSRGEWCLFIFKK
jgi:ribosomal protein L11 methyltransferase